MVKNEDPYDNDRLSGDSGEEVKNKHPYDEDRLTGEEVKAVVAPTPPSYPPPQTSYIPPATAPPMDPNQYPHAPNLNVMPAPYNNWAKPYCDTDLNTCCWAFWCDCCIFGQSQAMFNGADEYVDTEPWSMVCTWSCWGQFCIAANFGLPCILPCALRNRMRFRYNIHGPETRACCCEDNLDDFCVETFCPWFGRVQVYETIKFIRQNERAAQMQQQPYPVPTKNGIQNVKMME